MVSKASLSRGTISIVRGKWVLAIAATGVTLLASMGKAQPPAAVRGMMAHLAPASGIGSPAGAPSLPHGFEPPGTPVVKASSMEYLPGSGSVTPTGQFTYSIPLNVPAGRAGMQPSLGLSYSSGSGDGLLGVGWSLAGSGSSITQCGRTLTTEGVVDGVDFSAADPFCLDGQKLVAVGSVNEGTGAYGGIDTQYRTEPDSFAQIVSTETRTLDGEGPERFVVKTKEGHIFTYAAVEAIRIAAANSGKVTELGMVRVQWLLATDEDRVGNAITYEYNTPMQGSGTQASDYALDIPLLRIHYTSNDAQGLPAYRYVELGYEDRPSVEAAQPAWQSGIASIMPCASRRS